MNTIISIKKWTFLFQDFQKMVNPPKPPERPKPTKAEFKHKFRLESEDSLKAIVQDKPKILTPEPSQGSTQLVEFDKNSCSVDVNASFSEHLFSMWFFYISKICHFDAYSKCHISCNSAYYWHYFLISKFYIIKLFSLRLRTNFNWRIFHMVLVLGGDNNCQVKTGKN